MHAEDFLIINDAAAWGDSVQKLNENLIRQVHEGAEGAPDDLEAAVALARLVHDEFKDRGTNGNPHISVEESRTVMLALCAVLKRLDIQFNPPFVDFNRFHTYWKENGGSNKWEARRKMLSDLFDPVHSRLADMEAGVATYELAQPVSPRKRTGWDRVDEEIAELRRQFHDADTPAGYSAVGNASVRVLEAISEAAYAPERHLREGETEPPVSKTKNRFDRIIEIELAGHDSEKMRSLFKSAVGAAHSVKHSTTPTRREAGIAADSVILLAHIMRRLREDKR